MRRTPAERPRRDPLTLEELDVCSGLDSLETLHRTGSIEIGTRAQLGISSGESDRAKNLYVALFPAGDRAVPLVAYTLTRVLPAYRRYCPDHKRPLHRML